jgi:translation elongation factor EF-4
MAKPDAVSDAILSLQSIAGRDFVHMLEDGFCNPYVVAKLQGQVEKTKIIKRSTESELQEQFVFKVYISEISRQTLFLECFDKGVLRDRLLGVYQQEVSPLDFGRNLEAWIPLEQQKAIGAGKF